MTSTSVLDGSSTVPAVPSAIPASPQAFRDYNSRHWGFATKPHCLKLRFQTGSRDQARISSSQPDRSIDERTVHHLAMIARALCGGESDQFFRARQSVQ
jgi:hypothetical protein